MLKQLPTIREPQLMSQTTVGTRISFHGALGTILYIGPVTGTSGEWFGVDWDDVERGKHDGTKNGVYYFSCRYTDFVWQYSKRAHISPLGLLECPPALLFDPLHPISLLENSLYKHLKRNM
jgi:hypothetical protein